MEKMFLQSTPPRKVVATVENDTSGTLGALTVRIDKITTTDITYIGKAPVGSSEVSAVWQIFTIDKTTSVTKTAFADGDTNFNNVWNDRVSLTYT